MHGSVWISVEGTPATKLVPAFSFAWEVREGLQAAGVDARLFSVLREWEEMAGAGPRAVFPIEELCSTPPYDGDPAGVRQRLEDEGIPFVGTGARQTRCAADKAAVRDRLRAAGLPVAAGLSFAEPVTPAEALRRYGARFRFPAVTKPARGGNSRGVFYASDAEALEAVLERWDRETRGALLVEEYVAGPELTAWVGGVGDDLACAALRPIDRLGHPIFNRAAKAGVPAGGAAGAAHPPIPAPARGETAALAVAAHRALGLFSYSRVDLVVSEWGPVILEVNARPHLTAGGQVSVADGDPAAFGAFLAARVEDALRRPPAPAS